MRAAFESAHSARFGFIDPGKAIEIEAVEVEAVGGGAAASTSPSRAERPSRGAEA